MADHGSDPPVGNRRKKKIIRALGGSCVSMRSGTATPPVRRWRMF